MMPCTAAEKAEKDASHVWLPCERRRIWPGKRQGPNFFSTCILVSVGWLPKAAFSFGEVSLLKSKSLGGRSSWRHFCSLSRAVFTLWICSALKSTPACSRCGLRRWRWGGTGVPAALFDSDHAVGKTQLLFFHRYVW